MARDVVIPCPMPSRFLLALAALPLVACTPAPYTVTQHGLIAAPRPALYDGQPLATRSRIEGHFSTARVTDLGRVEDSGAAVARHQAGGAIRAAINSSSDIGLEGDAAWSATESTLSGDSSVSTGVPDAAVIDAAVAFRSSVGEGAMRLGFAVAVGMSSSPIRREGHDGYSRDEAGLFRGSLVPSYRMGNVTLYGSIGGATQSDIKESFTVTPDSTSNNDPGVVVETTQIVLTVAAGASFDLGDRARLTAQVGEVFGHDAKFGPQAMAGLSVDLGGPAPR